MANNFDEELGRTLVVMRKQAGLTQDDVAKRMGITKAAVSHYENGTRQIYASVLKQYCKAVGVKVQYVFDYMDENK